MKRVVIESPLSGDRELHKLYARACALDCLLRGESPYASHLFFDHPDLLDDTVQHERQLGIRAGFAWAQQAELRVFYLDLGESAGMKLGREHAAAHDQPIEDRYLFGKPLQSIALLTTKQRTELIRAYLGDCRAQIAAKQ